MGNRGNVGPGQTPLEVPRSSGGRPEKRKKKLGGGRKKTANGYPPVGRLDRGRDKKSQKGPKWSHSVAPGGEETKMGT